MIGPRAVCFQRGELPQLVPPRMLNFGWEPLKARGRLSNRAMLDVLRIYRSSVVCAVLAGLPGISVLPDRDVVVRYDPPVPAARSLP